MSICIDELIDPLVHCFTPEVAQRITHLRASARLEAHIHDLAEKSNEGTLTPEERAEYETLTRYVKFVSLLQSKARTLLKQSLTT